MTNFFSQKLKDTTDVIRKRCEIERIQGAIILGSGLGGFADTLENVRTLAYAETPHFCPSTIAGHAGQLVIGDIAPGFTVACMKGRFHYYEGHSMDVVTFPVRALQALGADFLLVSNAAGGIRPDLKPGDIMLLHDHINLMGVNPLRGAHDESFGPRFPDMTTSYDPKLREIAQQVAISQGGMLPEGVYTAVSGPCYETPAEVRMLAALGADAVGMSTVPEVIVARQVGLRVLGLSLISNQAAGLSGQPLHHGDVLATAEQGTLRFVQLVQGILRKLAHSTS